MTDSSVTDRGFPGGRAKLPLLGNQPGTARANRRVTFVGTAFVRARGDEDRSSEADKGPNTAEGFAGYFTYESLFEEGPTTIEAGPPAEVEALDVLGVAPDTPWEQVVATYRRLVKAHHPDRHASEPRPLREANTARFRAVSEAFARIEAAHRASMATEFTAPSTVAG